MIQSRSGKKKMETQSNEIFSSCRFCCFCNLNSSSMVKKKQKKIVTRKVIQFHSLEKVKKEKNPLADVWNKICVRYGK